jgi:hypothetical protein
MPLAPVRSIDRDQPLRYPVPAIRRQASPAALADELTADFDKVAFLLDRIKTAADHASSVDDARIAELRASLALGAFKKDAAQIARSVVARETLLYRADANDVGTTPAGTL